MAIPAVDPATSTEQGQPLQRPGALPLEPIRPVSLPIPLGNLSSSLRTVVGGAQQAAGGSGGPSPHLSGQFADALSSGPGAAEAGAAESAGTGAVSLSELAPLALAIHAGTRLTGASTQRSAPDLER